VLSLYASRIQSFHLLYVEGCALAAISPLLLSRLQNLRVDCLCSADNRALTHALPLCASLHTLFLVCTNIDRICGLLSELSHPLHTVLRFELDASFIQQTLQEAHARVFLAQLPSAVWFKLYAHSFSERARALYAARAPNCEIELKEY